MATDLMGGRIMNILARGGNRVDIEESAYKGTGTGTTGTTTLT